MKTATLSDIRHNPGRQLKQATREQVVITRRGKPIGILIGFASEEDWFDYVLENHPRLEKIVAQARAELRAGRGVRLEDIDL
jgi:prevent-host-death family protein